MKHTWSALIIFFTCLCSFTFLSSQGNVLELVEKSVNKRSQYESMSYTLDLQFKMFHMEDTLTQTGQVELKRNLNDTIYGGLFIIKLDTLWYAYDGNQIVEAVLPDSSITIGDAHQHPGLWIKSTWLDNFMDYGFLKMTAGPKVFLNDDSITKEFSDTVIAGWPCQGILFKLPDHEDFSDQRFFVAIDTLEYMVRSRMHSVFYQGNEQYTNWLYTQISYDNKPNIPKLEGDFIATFKKLKQYSSVSSMPEEQPVYDYAQLTGKPYNADDIFQLVDIKTNFIILDFWYTSCYPCIKGIPSVNRLYRDYKDKGVAVYGVNMIDDEVKSKARLEKFFKNNLMEYPPIMVDPAMANEIGIRSFPTLLVLDKDYQIVYMEDGFSEQLYEKVAAFLDTRL